jgi:hypothetical protein
MEGGICKSNDFRAISPPHPNPHPLQREGNLLVLLQLASADVTFQGLPQFLRLLVYHLLLHNDPDRGNRLAFPGNHDRPL